MRGCRAVLFAALGYGLLVACSEGAQESEHSPSNTGGGSGSGGGGAVSVPDWITHHPGPVRCENRFVPSSPAARPATDAGATLGDAGPTPARDEEKSSCTYDSDCTEKPYGQCTRLQSPNLPPTQASLPYDVCRYGCIEDSDCDAGMICECGDEIGRCVPASCTGDTDCASGALCLLEHRRNPCGGIGFDDDRYECGTVGTECTPSSGCDSRVFCINGHCDRASVCGRPFLVEGTARLAAPAARSDYARALEPQAIELTAADRAALAAHWTEVGLMEHASVAAFARFTLELLSFGAPPELVEASNAALADELEHARLAFGLATAYGGAPVGPGALAVERALGGTSFVESVRTAFLEACVGETCAAVEASEARHFARDGAARRALDRIAADELRHAALGYRFVRWALETSAPEVARSLRSMIAAELARLEAEPVVIASHHDETALIEHGLLPEAARAASRSLALREVVGPAVRALLAPGKSTIVTSDRSAGVGA